MSEPASSYYLATATPSAPHATLQGRHDARVCVIGGGFAGLNTALGLAERGVRDVVVLEARTPGFGASGRNGGFVFGGFSRGEDALLRELGPARAKALYGGTIQAVELIRERIARYAIDCEHTEQGVIWANWFKDDAVLRDRQALLTEHYDTHWTWWPRDRLRSQVDSHRYHDALFEPQGFHFHPLNYARGLVRAATAVGVAVHADSPALSVNRVGGAWRVRTPEGEVEAAHVVLACGGYLAGLRARVDAAVLPIATYVMVTAPLGDRLQEILRTGAAIYDTRFAFDYYRPLPDTRILWGGRISVLDRSPIEVRRLLYRDMLKVFPQLDGIGIDYAWSGLMSYARHQMPQIGQIEPGLWLAQAFGGHGVAPTTFAGEVLAAAIAHDDPRWREFTDYGLVSALKPAGLLGAQLSYWWAESKDAWKDWRERARGV
ncbi:MULTISPECIES: FAD-binding oxidoreductase [unclassified Pseudoxanthomonas]|uniref:NAD(P)/FAD-dependent oxidoreductase n=1 Tax=unclassified Pseudoxanthomonas TaxID=2645906 RepID=UPI0008F3FBE0|nr:MULTISPECIES: FAD-binding oxidoreductase [unclassified Pseudoxanthomonas]PPJ42785.1 FAD-binding oxidoreductase [Pseudoxanthomonas sp. KAs_5_3]SFV26299.1 gamma-glutamylputrescine oxidase [Pseudoxanthomonas sp. YR558]